jgi:hypothetical protein
MAEEVIGLRIQLNGINAVIQDVETFERLLREANQDLKQIPIGSNNYKQLKQEIAAAQKQLAGLNNEQKEQKKDIREFAEVGNAITGAFAGAAAAITLFGGESERITEAQKFASEALTIVLTAQSLAQIKLGDDTIKQTIAQKAQTLATNTSNTALKTLYTTIAANPIGALIVAIGALAAAFSLLGDDTEKYETQLNNLNNSLERSKAVFNSYSQAIQSNTAEGIAILEKDGKSFREITEFKLQGITEQINALQEQQKTELSYSNQLQKIREQEILSQTDYWKKLYGTTEFGSTQLNKARTEGEIEREKIERSFSDKIEALRSQKSILLIEIQKNENEETIKDTQKTNEELLKLYQSRLEFQLFYLEELSNINDIETDFTDDVVKRAQDVLTKLKKIQQDRKVFFTNEAEGFKDEINKILFDTVPQEDFEKIRTSFLSAYDLISQSILNGSLKVVDESGRAISFSFTKIKEIIDNSDLSSEVKNKFDELNKDQQSALTQYFTLFAQTAERYSKEFKIGDALISIGDKETIQNNLTSLIKGVGDILQNEDILPGSRKTAINELILSIFKFPTKEAKDFITEFDETGKVGFEAYNKGLLQIINNLTEFGLVQNNAQKSFEELKIELKTITDEITKINGELTTNIQLTDDEIIAFSEKLSAKIRGNASLLQVFVEDVSNNITKYTERFTKEGLVFVFNDLVSNLDKIEGLTRDQLSDLLTLLLETKETIVTDFGEGSAKGFEELINKILAQIGKLDKETSNSTKKLSDETLESLDKISKGIQQFQQILGSLGQTFADSFALELERLEVNYNNALDGVVGDTKEANEKRIELEKGYQKEKKAIEKQARLTSLRIQLAETIAAGAQGVVTALAILPPAGQILAGINAAIAAAQIALVAQQISFVSSLRRGGRLAAGGTVMGPSHENGGVRYMNGGVELEGNEAVVNRNSTIKYGSLLSSINQAEGGRPILIGNAMDSRLIEVLAKQKQEPIRAYVLESDITKSQTINRKLEQLASF